MLASARVEAHRIQKEREGKGGHFQAVGAYVLDSNAVYLDTTEAGTGNDGNHDEDGNKGWKLAHTGLRGRYQIKDECAKEKEVI